jgi:hypothetical protein
MPLPLNPTNNQTAVLNGILYTYNSTKGAWSVTTNSEASYNMASLTASGLVTAANIRTTSGVFWSNSAPYGVYTSTNAGNVTISGSSINLTSTGPGATSAGSSTAIPVITADAYGRISALSTAVVVAPAGTLSGATLASGVTASSLTSVGTLTSLSVTGAITSGGTISASGTGGFSSSTYAVGARNPIWRFGNADGFGLSYFQGASGVGGGDTIGIHFGTATAAGSFFQINQGAGTVVASAHVNPSATNTYDLGTSSLRWRNIYTQDLHLSNGIGDYTVIEGVEDLFLVNNKSGRSFKFALIEVDPALVPPKSHGN